MFQDRHGAHREVPTGSRQIVPPRPPQGYQGTARNAQSQTGWPLQLFGLQRQLGELAEATVARVPSVIQVAQSLQRRGLQDLAQFNDLLRDFPLREPKVCTEIWPP